MEDLLWSDPMDVDEETGIEFKGRGKNDQRNDAGCLFGCDVVDRFFADNGRLNLIVRSHECVDAGYEWFFDSKLVTVFSASRYRGKDDNLGAVMLVTRGDDASVKGVGNGGVTLHGGLRYRFIQYEAKKKERAKEFSLRLASLENQVLTLMVRHISHRRLSLIHHFDNVSKATGTITRRQWKFGLNKIIGVDVPFLSFQDALGLPMYGVDGTFRGPIDYMSFLSRFAPLYRHLRAEVDVDNDVDDDVDNDVDNDVAKKSPKEEQEDEGKVKKANELLGQLAQVADRSGIRNVETLFRYFDYDGDGALSVEEFKVGLLSLTKVYPDLKFTSKEVDAVAATLGNANGQISYREFFQNITVADNAYGRLVSLDNKAESLRADLDRLPNLQLRKKISDELDATERKRDSMNVRRMVKRHSIGLLAPPALVKAKSVPVKFDRKMNRKLGLQE
uniref:EF-hand domain-containing protein n=1 Tax=Lotharella globosa TaxID=91324 RepID=A0A7S3Z237_9EUKA